MSEAARPGLSAVLVVLLVCGWFGLAGGLVGCGAPTSAVRFRLDPMADGGGRAVPRSLVRAVPIGTSPTPLPVSLDAIGEALEAGGDTGYTDESGRLTLRLMRGHAHLVVVTPLPFGLDDAEAVEPPVWNWRLDEDLRTLTRWHTPWAGTAAAQATAAGPTLRVEP